MDSDIVRAYFVNWPAPNGHRSAALAFLFKLSIRAPPWLPSVQAFRVFSWAHIDSIAHMYVIDEL
jgi:hypothetical protein